MESYNLEFLYKTAETGKTIFSWLNFLAERIWWSKKRWILPFPSPNGWINTKAFDFLLRLPASLFLCDPRLASLMIHNFYAGGITKFATFSGPNSHFSDWTTGLQNGSMRISISFQEQRLKVFYIWFQKQIWHGWMLVKAIRKFTAGCGWKLNLTVESIRRSPTKCPDGQSLSAAEKDTRKSIAKSVLSEQIIT